MKGLTDVKTLQATFAAFAALKGDGSVLAWGSESRGGDTSVVGEQLQATFWSGNRHFLAHGFSLDFRGFSWILNSDFKAPRGVSERWEDIERLEAGSSAFVAFKADGSLITWGHSGGDARIMGRLQNIKMLRRSHTWSYLCTSEQYSIS